MRVFKLEELPELLYLINKRSKDVPVNGSYNRMASIPSSVINNDPLYMRLTRRVFRGKARNKWE